MSDTMIWILAIGGFTAVILIIRFVVRALVNKGSDAIQNAYIDRKNRRQPSQQENLADRFQQSPLPPQRENLADRFRQSPMPSHSHSEEKTAIQWESISAPPPGGGRPKPSTKRIVIGVGALLAIVIVAWFAIRHLSPLVTGFLSTVAPEPASTVQPTPAVSASSALIEEPEPEIPAESINWQNITCQYTDAEGYTFEVSIKMSPWILQSNTSLIDSAWETVGKGNTLPGIDGWGLKKFTGNGYLGEFSDPLAANGKRFSATMTDMYYIVGTISIRNITDGWSFSSDNPGSARVNLYWSTFWSSNPTTMAISRIFYGDSEKTYGGTMRALPSMTSDNWGPVPFVIAHGELFNPNSPDGTYRSEVESGEFIVMGGHNTEIQRLNVGIQDAGDTNSPQDADATQPDVEGDAGPGSDPVYAEYLALFRDYQWDIAAYNWGVGDGQVAIADILGDETPEFLFLSLEHPDASEAYLSVYRYENGSSRRIYYHVKDIKAGSGTYYCLFKTDDGKLYLYTRSASADRIYSYTELALNDKGELVMAGIFSHTSTPSEDYTTYTHSYWHDGVELDESEYVALENAVVGDMEDVIIWSCTEDDEAVWTQIMQIGVSWSMTAEYAVESLIEKAGVAGVQTP